MGCQLQARPKIFQMAQVKRQALGLFHKKELNWAQESSKLPHNLTDNAQLLLTATAKNVPALSFILFLQCPGSQKTSEQTSLSKLCQP